MFHCRVWLSGGAEFDSYPNKKCDAAPLRATTFLSNWGSLRVDFINSAKQIAAIVWDTPAAAATAATLFNQTKATLEVSWNRGTLKNHPFIAGMFHEITIRGTPMTMETPICFTENPWKPSSSFGWTPMIGAFHLEESWEAGTVGHQSRTLATAVSEPPKKQWGETITEMSGLHKIVRYPLVN